MGDPEPKACGGRSADTSPAFTFGAPSPLGSPPVLALGDPEPKACGGRSAETSPAYTSTSDSLKSNSSNSRESGGCSNQEIVRADRLMSLEVELEELLGKGSYGMVYRATTPRHGELAVKVLPWAQNEVSSELKK